MCSLRFTEITGDKLLLDYVLVRKVFKERLTDVAVIKEVEEPPGGGLSDQYVMMLVLRLEISGNVGEDKEAS